MVSAGLHIDYRIASLIAIECAIINNFFWNLRWTFKERTAQKHTPLLLVFLKFNLSSGLVALTVNWTLLILGAELLHLPVLLANLIGIALGTAANFLISHFWTFAQQKHSVDPERIIAS